VAAWLLDGYRAWALLRADTALGTETEEMT
jgi:hypothetical protein